MKKTLLLSLLPTILLSGCGLFDSPRLSEFQLNVINETNKPNSFGDCGLLRVNVSNSNKPDLVINKSEVTGEQVFKIPFMDNHSYRVNERLHTISIACDDNEKQVFSFSHFDISVISHRIKLYHKSTVPSWLSYVSSINHVGTIAEAQAGPFVLIKR